MVPVQAVCAGNTRLAQLRCWALWDTWVWQATPCFPMFFAEPQAIYAQDVVLHRASVADTLLTDVTLNTGALFFCVSHVQLSHLPGAIHEWSYLSRRCISLWAARRAFLAAAAREDAGPPPPSGGAVRVVLSWRHASAIRLLQPPARKIASTTLFLPNMLSTNTLYLMMLETGGRRKLAFNCKSQLCEAY